MLDFVLSPQMFPTTESNLIQCQYHLDVEMDVKMAADLEVHPKIVLALMPVPGQPVFNIFANYHSGW